MESGVKKKNLMPSVQTYIKVLQFALGFLVMLIVSGYIFKKIMF